MKYMGTLIAVSDMERSRRFYREVMGLKVEADFGDNVILECGISLQTVDSWKRFVGSDEVVLGALSSELYFEEANLDLFLSHLQYFDLEYVHKPLESGWGQRVIRFYDPDRHIIEVTEEISSVVRRFVSGGMSIKAVAERMDVPEDYVLECLEGAMM